MDEALDEGPEARRRRRRRATSSTATACGAPPSRSGAPDHTGSPRHAPDVVTRRAPDAASASTARQHRQATRRRGPRRAPLLPALIFTIVVTQIPFLLTLAISTLSWNAAAARASSALRRASTTTAPCFTDARLRNALVNTVVLTAGAVVLISSLLGLVLAVLLDRKFPGRGLARTLLIAPFLVMPVASALLWKHALYNPTTACSTAC